MVKSVTFCDIVQPICLTALATRSARRADPEHRPVGMAIGTAERDRYWSLSLKIQGQFFDFFGGMLAASLDNTIADHMDTIRWPDLLPTNTC